MAISWRNAMSFAFMNTLCQYRKLVATVSGNHHISSDGIHLLNSVYKDSIEIRNLEEITNHMA